MNMFGHIYYNDWKKPRFYNCFVQARSELTVAFLNEHKEEKKSFNQLHLDSLETIVHVLNICASLSVLVFFYFILVERHKFQQWLTNISNLQ